MALLPPIRLDATPDGVRVVTDEIITTTTPSSNGSNPMWSAGAPLLVRENGNMWASISVHDPEAAPYCNTHWELWRRTAGDGWSKINQGPAASEREPCPIFLLDPNSLVVSMQPKILMRAKNTNGDAWFCLPSLGVFDPERLADEPQVWTPVFNPGAAFTQHSYRSVGVDFANRSFLLLVIDRDDIYRPTWRDGEGVWYPLAPLTFPVRACYPEVVLRDRAAHVFAIGDIKEPNQAWKDEKLRVLKRDWDYAFRRLFYTWSPDLAEEGLRTALEVDSADDTAGLIRNLDMLVDDQNRVHLLWFRRNIQYGFIRDRFFPGQPIVESVMHAVIEQGRVIAREALTQREVAPDEPAANSFTDGRLHLLPDGRLFAVIATSEAPEGIAPGPGLFIKELDSLGQSTAPPIRVPLARPPQSGRFFTNTLRGGSAPSHDLDLLMTETDDGIISLRYIHVQIP